MKKVLQFVLMFLFLSDNSFSATRKKSVRVSSTTTKSTYSTPTQDQCNVDIDYCFSRYCFDKKTMSEGVYSKCDSEPASRILINVEDCLATRAVIKQLDLQNGCKNYSYNRVVSLLANKDIIETGLKKNSADCQKATRALSAAKKCYTAMISSDGSSSIDLYNQLDELCGFDVSGDSYMLNRFYFAGDYGDSNIGALEDLRLTGQNTSKRENWRQVVDATLAGYTEMAELACGAEDYKITKVNQYALDSHENSAMIGLMAQAEEIGRQSADNIVNKYFRESDCVNSPLPVGGLYWSYKKGGNPDCKLVCKEGYVIGRNSSECVKIQEKKDTFIGLNVGNNWVQEKKEVQKKTEKVVERKDSETVVEKKKTYTNICSKSTTTYDVWYPKNGIKGVCDVFFPNCNARYYARNTDAEEFFCTGSKSGEYDKWYNMKLSNDNGQDLNSIFGTNYARFGDNYSEQLSAVIKEKCLSLCSDDDCSSKASTVSVKSWKNNPNSNGSSECFPKECQAGYHLCDFGDKDCCKDTEDSCSDLPAIDTGYYALNQWQSYLNKYDLPKCVNNEKSRLSILIEQYVNPTNCVGKNCLKPKSSDLTNVMKQIKDCACDKSLNETSSKNDWCSVVKKLPSSVGSMSQSSDWLGFLHKYDESGICDVSDVSYVVHNYSEFFFGGKDVIKEFKNCVCKENKTYDELVEKYCKKTV